MSYHTCGKLIYFLMVFPLFKEKKILQGISLQELSSLSARGRLSLSKYLKALLTGRPAGHHATWYPKHL